LEKIDILVEIDSLSISKSKKITGEIYWSLDNKYFPEEGWNDFVVIILSWWHKTLFNIKETRINTSHQFNFMDGPLLVKATKITDDSLKLACIKENKDSNNIFFTSTCSISQLETSLSNATKKLLKEIDSKGWHSDDIDDLVRMFNIINN
jgi:hypothetical protein